MKKQESILGIQKFSESEEDEPNEAMDVEQSEDEDLYVEPEESETKQTLKTRKKGIIYISQIPKHMNVAICRELMERFGEVGRIFLQPDSKGSKYFTCTVINNCKLTEESIFSDKKSQQKEKECYFHWGLGWIWEEKSC